MRRTLLRARVRINGRPQVLPVYQHSTGEYLVYAFGEFRGVRHSLSRRYYFLWYGQTVYLTPIVKAGSSRHA